MLNSTRFYYKVTLYIVCLKMLHTILISFSFYTYYLIKTRITYIYNINYTVKC